jgi:hypothetical protein
MMWLCAACRNTTFGSISSIDRSRVRLRFRVTFRVGHQDADPPQLTGLLPPRALHPHREQQTATADQGNELTPFHSMVPR